MATVIFSNAGDTDTAVLRFIWKGIPNVKVVEVNKNTVNAKATVEQAIEAEHDTLICCGHGSQMGLFDPSGTGYSFLINRQNYKKIKVNRFIGVWCHASEYGEAVHLKGFYSSMFISNKKEAEMNHCYQASDKAITDQEILFCLRLNELIVNYIPMKKWVDMLNNAGDKTIDVVKFNYDGLKYLTKFTGTVPEYTEYGYQSYSSTSYDYSGYRKWSSKLQRYIYGRWDTSKGKYVYDEDEEEEKKEEKKPATTKKAVATVTKTQTPSLSSPSLDYYRKTYGIPTKKETTPATKQVTLEEDDWNQTVAH